MLVAEHSKFLWYVWFLVMQGEVKLEDRLLGTEDYFIVEPRTIATTFVLKTATTIEAN